MRALIIAFLLLIPATAAQLALDFTPPQVINITLRQSEEGIFCRAQTNEVSWPIFHWRVNDRPVSGNEPLLTSGYGAGDSVECEVTATTGFENSSARETITAIGSAPAITGAIIGGGSSDAPPIGTWVLVLVLSAVGAALAVTNVRMYRKTRK